MVPHRFHTRLQSTHGVCILADDSYAWEGVAHMWIADRGTIKGFIFIALPRIVAFVRQLLVL